MMKCKSPGAFTRQGICMHGPELAGRGKGQKKKPIEQPYTMS